MNPPIRILLPLCLCFTACLAPRSNADGWSIRATDAAWRLEGFEHSKDLSALASAGDGHAIVVTDEGNHLQAADMDSDRREIRARAPVALPVPDGLDAGKAEADLEGAVWSPRGNCYYIVGSHGLGKKKGDHQESRHGVFRVPKNAAEGEITRVSLAPVIKNQGMLRDYYGKPLQQNGFNIEGLAEKDGVLWFGLRAPNINDRGFVIEADADDLFAGRHSGAKVHEVELGAGRGIREIIAVSDGFLVLAGNASAEASKKFPETMAPGPDTDFTMHHWVPGENKPALVGTVPSGNGKAEGMMVLQDGKSAIHLLVIFDGVEGGGPLELELTRPRLSAP